MLRLFGIAEKDDGEFFISEHARKQSFMQRGGMYAQD